MFILSLLSDPISTMLFFAVLVIIISVHEYAHARAAHELGDPTAELAGRLTLNPKAHLDPIGSLMFLLVGFGWGKPVPFDPYNLKDPRRDAAIISFAGPAANFIMALLASILLFLLNYFNLLSISAIGFPILGMIIHYNLVLGIFNLLPFAPLDGFKIVGGFLSEEQAGQWYSLERYGLLFLLFFIMPLVGNRSMLELFVIPFIDFLTKFLIRI